MTSRHLPRLLRRLLAGGVALTALLALMPLSPAQAVQDSSALSRKRLVERTGTCGTSSAHWKLKAKRAAGGRIYVEFEVDSIPRGARWQLFVSHNGQRIAAVTQTARTRRGVQVSRITPNRAGRDGIRAAGVNPRTGTSCSGNLRY